MGLGCFGFCVGFWCAGVPSVLCRGHSFAWMVWGCLFCRFVGVGSCGELGAGHVFGFVGLFVCGTDVVACVVNRFEFWGSVLICFVGNCFVRDSFCLGCVWLLCFRLLWLCARAMFVCLGS